MAEKARTQNEEEDAVRHVIEQEEDRHASEEETRRQVIVEEDERHAPEKET